jgi:hypothetical protein
MILYLASSVGLQWAFMYFNTNLVTRRGATVNWYGALNVDIMGLARSLWTVRAELLSNLVLMSAVMILLMSWRRRNWLAKTPMVTP